MEANNQITIPQHVADAVSNEAKYAAVNFRSAHSIQVSKYEDFYERAVTPYAERVYILEQLVRGQEQLIKILQQAISDVSTSLVAAQQCIDKIVKK